eukprot:CAMPEP_0119374470 /NCGR_PEP_ID=MMETSP1334-20130426/30621_1 /TAXON_ID=127549 /ORGANISM="Calcidiscus leptoporus, Strain RCC1130" /LENGTH=83 /DNA_ID=CAMNT_0007392543 /DNA_START=68 /DNA_END=316 /DNA_ORIENTATION=-
MKFLTCVHAWQSAAARIAEHAPPLRITSSEHTDARGGTSAEHADMGNDKLCMQMCSGEILWRGLCMGLLRARANARAWECSAE